MCKKLYRFIVPNGDTITVCKRCIREHGTMYAVMVEPADPTTCDKCFELYYPNFREEMQKVRKLVTGGVQ